MNRISVFSCISVAACIFFIGAHADAALDPSRFNGKILLQVQQYGEAWYVKPQNGRRVYMGRPDDAFRLMRQLGVGITNKNLAKIPIADMNLLASRNDEDGDWLSAELEKSFGTDPKEKDTDGDGHDDKMEILNGFDPLGPGALPIDLRFAKKKGGIIFLQVESAGEAWYVNPTDAKRYYLGRPYDALSIMKTTGLGISNNDLYAIKEDLLNYDSHIDLSSLEAGQRVSSTQVRSISRIRRSNATDTIDTTILFAGELQLRGIFLRDEKCLTELDTASLEILPQVRDMRFDARICFTNTAQLEKQIERQSIPQRTNMSMRFDNLTVKTDGLDYATYSAEFLDFISVSDKTLLEQPDTTPLPMR